VIQKVAPSGEHLEVRNLSGLLLSATVLCYIKILQTWFFGAKGDTRLLQVEFVVIIKQKNVGYPKMHVSLVIVTYRSLVSVAEFIRKIQAESFVKMLLE